ncbi:dispanin subfamily A member 2b-like isoform X2 [Lissotriton helveticus]
MAASAEKGSVAVPMNPEEHPKCQHPPPPYSERPDSGPSPPPYVLQPGTAPSPRRFDTVQLTVPAAPPPKDYVLWSLFNAMLCNFYCLGFAALAFSVKSRDRMVMRDVAAARQYGDSARTLNVATFAVGLVTIAFFLLKVNIGHWGS